MREACFTKQIDFIRAAAIPVSGGIPHCCGCPFPDKDRGKRAITIDEVPLDWCMQPGVKLDFRGLEDGFTATRYHSLAAVELPDSLEACAWSNEDDVVQGIRHLELPIHGVQFHPESIMTTEGKALLRNFLELS